MKMEISNVPVGCHICGSTAYGRESDYKTSEGVVLECIWVCGQCGGVAKRHQEIINDDSKKDK